MFRFSLRKVSYKGESMFLARKPLFWAVSFGHLTIDMFNGMGPVLLAFLSAHMLPLSNTQIGFAVSAYALVGEVPPADA